MAQNPASAFTQLAGMFMQQSANRRTAELQEQQIQLGRDRLDEQRRQFDGQEAFRNASTEAKTALSAEQIRVTNRANREDNAQQVFNVAKNFEFDGKKYITFGENGKTINYNDGVLAAALESGDRTAKSLVEGMLNFQPKNAAQREGGFTFDKVFPVQTGPDGKMLFGAGGTYEDGTDGVLSENATAAETDPGVLLTASKISSQFGTHIRNEIMSGTEFGRNVDREVAVTLSNLDARTVALQAEKDKLAGEVMTAVDGVAQANDDASFSRKFKMAYDAAETEEERNGIIMDMAETLGVEVDPVLQTEAVGVDPEEIAGERGTSSRFPTSGPVVGATTSLFSTDLSGDTKFNKGIRRDRAKVKSIDKDLEKLNQELSGSLTNKNREAKEQERSDLFAQRNTLINTANSNIYAKTKEEIKTIKKDIELAPANQKASLEASLADKEKELSGLIDAGVATPEMEKVAYKSLEKKVFSEENLAKLNAADPDALPEVLREMDAKIEAGEFNITGEEANQAQKVLEEHGVEATLASLRSAPLKDQLVTRAIVLAGTENPAERTAIRKAIDNVLATGDATLSTPSAVTAATNIETTKINRMNAETSAKNADTNAQEAKTKYLETVTDQLSELSKDDREEFTSTLDAFNSTDPDNLGLSQRISNIISLSPTDDNFQRQASSIIRELDQQVDRFVVRGSGGQITGTRNQKAFDFVTKESDRAAMGVLQSLAKENEGLFDAVTQEDFLATFNASTLGKGAGFDRLRANSTDPNKVTEFYVVDGNGEKIGGDIDVRDDLKTLPMLKNYLLTRVAINNARATGSNE
jgi:hypothetical protein